MLKSKRNISLRNLTTFHIGGRAKYFIQVSSKSSLKQAIILGKRKSLPFFILGGGSNVLISDKGYSGLVIKINNTKVRKIKSGIITVGAGMSLASLEQKFFQKGWKGMEWAKGIPGTVGGAIVGNAGAFGHSIQELVNKIITIDPFTLKEKNYYPKQCKFSYRDSIFKKNKDIVWEVSLRWQKGDKNKIQQQREKYWNYKSQQRHLFQYPSAGSVFKNIYIKDTIYYSHYHQLPHSLRGEVIIKGEKVYIKGGKLPAGWLIEHCGLKGYKKGSAMISMFHSNIIINLGKAKTNDVLYLIKLCKKKVWNKFKIKLEEEIIIK